MSKFQIVKGITNNLEETPYIEGKVYFTYDNKESEDITIYADIDGVRRKIKEGIKREDLDNYLLKTDIADWAKANTKPTYTSEEVGALNASHPASNVTDNKIQNWDSAYADSGKVTQTNSGATLSGYHPVLITKQNIVGDSENTDSVYKSNNLYLSNDGKLFDSYYGENGLTSSLQLKPRDLEIYAGEGNQTSEKGVILKFPKISSDENQTYTCVLPEKTGTIALINDLPAVPTKTSELINDSNYVENTYVADLDNPSVDIYNEVITAYNDGRNIVGKYENGEILLPLIGININSSPSKKAQLFGLEVNQQSVLLTLNSDGTLETNNHEFINVSQLTNDAGYITEETDPTVPAWAKEATKPTYTAAEVGALPNTTIITDEKVKQTPLNNNQNSRALLMGNDLGNAETTSTAYMSNKLIWNDYLKTLSIYNGTGLNSYIKPGYLGYNSGAYSAEIKYPDLHENYTYTLPTTTGTIALTSDIPSVPSWALATDKPSYTASEVGAATTSEVNSAIATAIGNINQFNVAIVSTLPTENIDNHTIYFMSNGGSDDSIYDEWMYINNNWEKIGTTAVDLSGYLQDSDIAAWAKAANKPTYTATEVGAVPEFVGNIANHSSRISSTSTSISIRQDNDSDPASSIALNISGIELGVSGRAGENKINLTQTETTIHNIVTPTADMDAANKKYVDDHIPQVYSSTNTTGYLTMDTLPIYDGTVE